jgi:tetratricopeptide (TPR) repeat protein
LLRLGDEGEGWRLASDVARSDAYDVSAYNLVTLHDTIARYEVLTNEHFILRMAPEEARVYGSQALALLEQARSRLTQKYGLDLTNRTTVEIFPDQKDFAVRTFGMPGGEGYLGVCFGNVITANSPAAHTMNWHSVLWHEFCHVVTLHLTENKMPRWLSEGISVYEERRADPRWGEQMDPAYREFITTGKMKPIAGMSSAFMAPPSGLYLQFAYYQSSLVVEFLIERFGLQTMRNILLDLGQGKPINTVLAARAMPLDKLQKDFDAFARGLAEGFGPDSVWQKPKRNADGAIDPAWAALNPGNYWVNGEKAEAFLEKDQPALAIPFLEKAIQLYPRQSGVDNAYASLSRIYRARKDAEKERETLARWVQRDAEAPDGLTRLVQLELASGDLPSAGRHAAALLQASPLSPVPYQALARSAEAAGQSAKANEAYNTELHLKPPDKPRLHYRLARQLQKDHPPAAKRHLLLALEEAPRFRAAHRLLLELEAH